MHVFKDRSEAGRDLARGLARFRHPDTVVLGLPRGGVPVAFEVAVALDAPLDVIVVRKLGVPFQPELAMGAIGEDGVRVLDSRVIGLSGVTDRELDLVERREREVLQERVARIRAERGPEDLRGKTAIVVDDGIATGSTAKAACMVARALGAARVVLAVPVGPKDVVGDFPEADEVVCLTTPSPFRAVGRFYRDFSPTTDDDVQRLLEAASHRPGAPQEQVHRATVNEEVAIPVDGTTVHGSLHLPASGGIVVFAHGSGSSRHSPRNRAVARTLGEAGLGTLLMDLLSTDEELERQAVFDIGLLASRLSAATEWLRTIGAGTRPIGYFGASTGAAAALWAAADEGADVRAVVSRGGRPDLAGPRLASVAAPTLLIVGGADHHVLELNREAAARLTCEHRLEVVPGATHLFEEPGALDAVAHLARDWFLTHLP
ncbi:phosphoribosyltransferase family protein [Sinomonas notoginsengisoli]|uniref:phosphoribosyltransferase family protein n=1 Tax=Sinomonas notoginsengisoli TaxID=1457311 RepID=UPI001F2F2184|nr:phosphoribosyltransferase family protein [Sinomonas notoginsengisoli]